MDFQSSGYPKIQLVLKLTQICESQMIKLEPRLKRRLERMEGVDSVEINAKEFTIIIKGSVDPCTILSMLKRFKIPVDTFSCQRIQSIEDTDDNRIQVAHQESKRSGQLEDEILPLSRIEGVRKIRVTKIVEVTIDHQVDKLRGKEIKITEPEVSPTSTMQNYYYSNNMRPPLWSGGTIPSAPPIPSDYEMSPIRSPPPPPPPPPRRPPPPPSPLNMPYSNTTILSDHNTKGCIII